MDAETGDEIASKNDHDQLEVASLTKKILSYLKTEANETTAIVPKAATFIGGTTAQLKANDILSIDDLLYALLLPSGNDAAITLACWGGDKLFQIREKKREEVTRNMSHVTQRFIRKLTPSLNQKQTEHIKSIKDILLSDYEFNNNRGEDSQNTSQVSHIRTIEENINRFIKEMNLEAAKLGMRETIFSNVHGLASKANKSTANDMGRLSTYFLRDEIMCKIVRTQEYHSTSSPQAQYIWKNTNILLNQSHFYGLKTGFTPNAGACLSVLYDMMRVSRSNNNIEKRSRNLMAGYVVVVLLGAKDQSKRFYEVDKLIQWVQYNCPQPQKIIDIQPIVLTPNIIINYLQTQIISLQRVHNSSAQRKNLRTISNDTYSMRKNAPSQSRAYFIIKPSENKKN